MNKIIIQSLNSLNYLIIESLESGGNSYFWTNDCNKATGFDSEEAAINHIKRFGFVNTIVKGCDVDYGSNGG